MICKECYGKGIKYHFDMVAGISTVGPCKCAKPKTNSVWLDNLIKKSAEYNQMSEEQVEKYIGVTT